MKAYLLHLIECDIFALQRSYDSNKYKTVKKRLDAAKEAYEKLSGANILYGKKQVRKILPPEVKEEIKQHLLKGEKQQWICATYGVAIGTVSKINKLINNPTL
jgi:DNA invertase Pin-like site-specific DNA recombinase